MMKTTLKRFKDQIKTKSQTKVSKVILSILLILGAVIVFTAPLVHIEFPRQNEKVTAFKNELNKVTDSIDNLIVINRTNYDNKIISAEYYVSRNDTLLNQLKSTQKLNKSLLKEEVNRNRVFGWKTTRLFLVGFGIRLPYLIFSIIISLLISFIYYLLDIANIKDGTLKNTLTFLQVTCYSISLYVLVWVFWNDQDYPLQYYRWAILGVGGLISLTVVYFLQYRFSKQSKYVFIIRSLFSFIFTETDKGNYIKEDKKELYHKKRIEVTKKIIDNE